MAGSQPIPPRKDAAGDQHYHPASSSLATSFRSGSLFANEIIASDIAECSDGDVSEDGGPYDEPGSEIGSRNGDEGPVLYKQLQGVAYGVRRPSMLPERGPEGAVLNKAERMQSLDAERSLLRDNHILPPKHSDAEKEPGPLSRLYRRLFSTKVRSALGDEEVPRFVVSQPSEASPLLSDAARAGQNPEDLNEQWDSAVASGKIKTTWQREAQTIAVYSRSLIVTFLLQYSINIASIFAVGRIGKIELGAVTCEIWPPPPPRRYPTFSFISVCLPIAIELTGKTMSHSGLNDGKHRLLRADARASDELRHAVRASLWVRAQASRGATAPADDVLPMATHATHRRGVLLCGFYPEADSARA